MWLAITRDQNSVSAIFNVVADMMFHSSGIRHTTGRNNNTWFISEVQAVLTVQLSLIYFNPLKLKGSLSVEQYLLNSFIKISWDIF